VDLTSSKDFTGNELGTVQSKEEACILLELVLAEQAAREVAKTLAERRLAEAIARVRYFHIQSEKACASLEAADISVGKVRLAVHNAGYHIHFNQCLEVNEGEFKSRTQCM